MTLSPLPAKISEVSCGLQCSNDTSSFHDENVMNVLSGLQINESTCIADDTSTSKGQPDDSNDHLDMFDSSDDEDESEQKPMIIPSVTDREEFCTIETDIGKLNS